MTSDHGCNGPASAPKFVERIVLLLEKYGEKSSFYSGLMWTQAVTITAIVER
jgi:hypothetical protein